MSGSSRSAPARERAALRLGRPLPSSPMLLILTVIVALVALVSLLVVSLA